MMGICSYSRTIACPTAMKDAFECMTHPGIRVLKCEKNKTCLRINEIREVKKDSPRELGKVNKRKDANSFSPSPSLPISLSLSLTHTHTHTHTQSLTHSQRLLTCWEMGAGGMS